jgi:hypothetical protein
MGYALVAAGWICFVAGAVLIAGPVALLGCGVLSIVAGLLPDWEARNGKPARPPAR